MSDISYLFLSGLFPKEAEKEILAQSIGSMQNAANVFQWNLVKGFDANLSAPIKIVNSLYIGSYPNRYRKLFIPSFKFSHCPNGDDLNVGFCNLTGYKQLSRCRTMARETTKWVRSTNGNKVVIAYAMTSVMMNALRAAKNADSSVTTCLIVPDLPQYMNMNAPTSIGYRFLKRIDSQRQEMLMRYVDCFVYLTEYMNEGINAENYVVVEGMVNEVQKQNPLIQRKEKTILYTGGMNEKYGTNHLIDAFMQIRDPDFHLIMCGSGPSVEYIKEAAAHDPRIEYMGIVAHDQIVELQQMATVLVNPRMNTEDFTKYSFPSKNMEYLASGTPVIAYKLDGIPNEYDEYINYVPDDTVEALKNMLERVCLLPEKERVKMGMKGRTFVLQEKSSIKQTEKILRMLTEVIRARSNM